MFSLLNDSLWNTTGDWRVGFLIVTATVGIAVLTSFCSFSCEGTPESRQVKQGLLVLNIPFTLSSVVVEGSFSRIVLLYTMTVFRWKYSSSYVSPIVVSHTDACIF